jgi:hypothetical protein
MRRFHQGVAPQTAGEDWHGGNGSKEHLRNHQSFARDSDGNGGCSADQTTTGAGPREGTSFPYESHRQRVQVPNVVAEIKGGELPDELVIVGAHLVSRKPETGAQDNGTVMAMVLKAARTMTSLDLPPSRTVRFVLFGGEEEGLHRCLCWRARGRVGSNTDFIFQTDHALRYSRGAVSRPCRATATSSSD